MTVIDEHANGRGHNVSAAHLVHFYRSEDGFAETVGSFLFEGLVKDEAVVVVATAAHREILARVMADSGIDVESAQQTGSLCMLDADETLSNFMVVDRPHPSQFESVIEPILSEAGANGRPVRVFGEMVAVLWEAGQVSAAMDLETCWNELLERSRFLLLCAYPAGAIGSDAQAAGELCGLHGEVVGRARGGAALGRRASNPLAVRTFEGRLASATAARRFVTDTLSSSGDEDLVDEAALVVTEFAANAVVHARSPFTVAVSSFDNGVEIAVTDDGPLVPRLTDPTATEANGRGLQLVAALVTRWGSTREGAGKVVWAEVGRNR